jgi:hypothetical protein|tara:strand:- start:2313 stop:2423 length:111 start_codon:yes stop_codon:yes gene_type:complete
MYKKTSVKGYFAGGMVKKAKGYAKGGKVGGKKKKKK